MPSRPRTYHSQNTGTSDLSNAPHQGMFQSQPFVMQSQATEKSQEQPELKVSLMRAERYGHHLSKMQPADDSATTAVQPKLEMGQPVQFMKRKRISISSIDDESDSLIDDESDLGGDETSDDDEYVEHEPHKGSKKVDPGSKIKEGSYKTTPTELQYETMSGAKHKEVYDQAHNTRTTKSSELAYGGPQYRNPAHRENKDFNVYNPYGLSKGQSSRNQMVVSHNTPSWAGFQAGKNFRNSSLTSQTYNSEIEKKERDWRDEVRNNQKSFSYETKTTYKDIESDDASEIEKKMTHPNWTKERIKKRIRKVKKIYPYAQRVAKEVRTFMTPTGREKKFTQGADLLAYMPARAWDENAAEKYREARDKDSDGSDVELEENKPKKKKKKK